MLCAGGRHSLSLAANGNLLDALQLDEELRLSAVCGGSGVCGKCKIRVLQGTLHPTPSDLSFFSREELAAGMRLACTAHPAGPLTIELLSPPDGDIAVTPLLEQPAGPAQSLHTQRRKLRRSDTSLARQALQGSGTEPTAALLADCSDLAGHDIGEADLVSYMGQVVYIGACAPALYAVGVDVGTTTVTYALLHLQSGRVLSHLSETNRQRQYGADVVTRMMKACSGGLSALHRIASKQVSSGVQRLLEGAGVRPAQVVRVAVAGNTTMLHLLLGLRCDSLGRSPFTPVTLEHLALPYRDLFEGPLARCTVDILPGLSTYVGADVTAGILMTGLHRSRSPSLLVDIGTNGEMALGGPDGIVCTSTSAGPAFEGANIRWGVSSIPGAICGVGPAPEGFAVQTIDDRPPVGICGSGVIDAVYACLRSGCLDASGRFARSVDARGVLLAATPDGEDIRFTQKDVRELQLSKSAVRSGIELLLRHTGTRCEDIEALYVSGGFGCRVRPQSGVGIGMIPAALEERIVPVGNSSLGGLIRYLVGQPGNGELDAIIGSAREFKLPREPAFQQLFIDNLSLKKY